MDAVRTRLVTRQSLSVATVPVEFSREADHERKKSLKSHRSNDRTPEAERSVYTAQYYNSQYMIKYADAAYTCTRIRLTDSCLLLVNRPDYAASSPAGGCTLQ